MIFLGPEDIHGAWRGGQKSPEGPTSPQGALPWLVASSVTPWHNSGAPWVSSGPQLITVNFYSVWTPFDIPFL
jgi:hypothetical protein